MNQNWDNSKKLLKLVAAEGNATVVCPWKNSIYDVQRYSLFLIIFLLYTIVCYGQMQQTEFHFNQAGKILLPQEFLQPFVLEQLVIIADIPIDEQEISYLLGFHEGDTVTSSMLENGLLYIKLKHAFAKVILRLEDGTEAHQKKLILQLVGWWTVNKTRIEGVWFGKERFRQIYLLEPGDAFDKHKHQHSLQQIKKLFNQQGYLNVVIEDRIHKNFKHKTVDVKLIIHKGNRFVISEIDIKEVATPLLGNTFNKFKKKLLHAYYSQDFIKKEVKKIKNFLKSQGFTNVAISLDEFVNPSLAQIKLVFTIELNPKKKFIIQGNHYCSTEELLHELQDSGYVFWDMPSSLMVEQIKSLYERKGFLQPDIEIQQEDGIVITINEGQKAYVHAIKLQGLICQDSLLLTRRFFLKQGNQYIAFESINQAIQKLIAFYKAQGFWDIVVKKEYVPYDSASALVDVIITIDEGSQRFLRSVTIEGYEDLAKKPFFVRFNNSKVSIPFDPLFLQEQRMWLLNYFYQQGLKSIEITPEFSSGQTIIDLIWKIKIHEANNVKIGKTVVVGNAKVPHHCIEQELLYTEGDDFDRASFERTGAKFREIGTFDIVHFYPASTVDSEGRRPILLKLGNNDRFEFRTRLGFQQVSNNHALTIRSRSSYKLGGSLLINNPTNHGDQLRFDADATLYYRHFALQYAHPWFFRKPIRSLVRCYTNQYLQPLFTGSGKNLYTIDQLGALLGFNYQLQQLQINLNAGLESMVLTGLSKRLAHAIDFSDRLVDKRISYFFIEPTILYESLDDAIYPTQGFVSFLSLRAVCSSYSKLSYTRVLTEQSFFWPLWNFIIGAVRLRFGHIFHRTFDTLMPSDRFYLGGSNSLRSFEPDMAPPLGFFIDDAGNTQFVPQGGKTMINANLELRIPFGKSLGLVLFEDLGFLLQNKRQEIKRFLTATGFGLRYFTPIGPIRFDIGWRPTQKDLKGSFAWFLTIGNSF